MGLGPEISTYLSEEEEIQNLHDFVAAFKSDADWDRFCAADIKMTDKAKQVPRGKRSRVAQCHDKCRKAQKTAADIKAKGAEAVDLDKALLSDEIIVMHKRFWLRHKVVSPLLKMPGDLLI